MTRKTDMDAGLDQLFVDARDDGPDASLMARVLADAEAVQREVALSPAPERTPKLGWLAVFVQSLGGWGSVGGVTAAGVMGLSMGLYAPEAVAGWIGTESLGLETLSYDITPDMGALWLEDSDV